jgi:hypothetical protein
MKNVILFAVMLVLFSCGTESVDPKIVGSKSNPVDAAVSAQATNCSICSNSFRTVPPCATCGGSFSGTRSVPGSYFYPSVYANICPNTTSIGIQMSAHEVPNYFTITYLDKNGSPVSSWTSGWMGDMTYPGPWGSYPQYAPNTKSTSFTTTAQTAPWPCPFIVPGTTATLSYQNITGTPVNGVTWSTLSNNPSGSTTLNGNGAINQSVSFSTSFSSVQLQATTNDPPSGGFQNCQSIVTINAPVLSNIASVKIDAWTVAPSNLSDRWDVTVSCVRNNSGANCAQCY